MDMFLKIYIPVYMIAFFLIAMVYPSYRLYKHTGITPITFGKSTESAHNYIGFLFKLIFIIVGGYGLLSSFIEFKTIEYIDSSILKIIGVVLSILSFILIIAAQRTMANSWRIGIDEKVKTKLVTNGAFKHIRNPIFSGMLLVLLSLFLVLPTYFMAYMTVLSYLITSIQVRLEEEYLTKVHSKDYLDYKAKVGRFIPKIFN